MKYVLQNIKQQPLSIEGKTLACGDEVVVSEKTFKEMEASKAGAFYLENNLKVSKLIKAQIEEVNEPVEVEAEESEEVVELSKDELIAKAKDLGIAKVNKSYGVEKIKSLIAEAEAELADDEDEE